MALAVPLLDSGRAREELGWRPRYTSTDAMLELLEGLREGGGYPTPPLDPATSGGMAGRAPPGDRGGAAKHRRRDTDWPCEAIQTRPAG